MVDIEKIKKTYYMDENTVLKLLNLFSESVQTDIRTLEKQVNELEFEQIHNVSHKLKAGVRYFFLDNISTRLEQMQQAAKSRDALRIQNLYEEIKPLLSSTLSEIKGYIPKS